MSQPDETLYIQPPMFETTVAVHITANVRLRNGADADAARGAGEAAGGFFAWEALILVVQDSVEIHANSKKEFSWIFLLSDILFSAVRSRPARWRSVDGAVEILFCGATCDHPR
jgi:hypothetical protein